MARDAAIRLATAGEAALVAAMLVDFSREFGVPTDEAEPIERRLADLLDRDHAIVPLALGEEGAGLGFGILIPRPTSFIDGDAALLEELYVVPELRGEGIGTRLLELAIATARERGVGFLEIGVDEPDVGAQRFYERHGFTNRAEPGSEERMFYFEREL